MEGFTYNGVHSSDVGVMYVPSADEMGDFFSDYEVISDEHSWADGGAYFKSRVKPRVFTLSCFYDRVDEKKLEEIIRWLDRRTSGELIFDSRPYASYFVHPTKRISVNDYLQGGGTHSGTFEVSFTAYHPFARLVYDNATDYDNAGFKAETGVLPKNVPLVEAAGAGNYMYVYNPGTERAHSKVVLKSSITSPVTLTNDLNKSKCTIKPVTLASGETIEIDSYTGRTEKVSSTGRTLCTEFHDDGFLVFEPCTPFYRDVTVHTTAQSKVVTSGSDVFNDGMVGQWILIGTSWRLISAVSSAKSITVHAPFEEMTDTAAFIGTRNMVLITSTETPSIEIKCYPEVR